jgi:hypothetical protein
MTQKSERPDFRVNETIPRGYLGVGERKSSRRGRVSRGAERGPSGARARARSANVRARSGSPVQRALTQLVRVRRMA